MKKIIIFIYCISAWLWSSAWHIVGGEIEFITIEPGVYRINLIQYFDRAQDDNPGPDPSVTVYLFSNGYADREEAFMRSFTLPLSNESIVEYTNFECSREDLQTSRIIYSQDFNLNPQDYDDQEGYYLVWERCCRNAQIDNIVNPAGTGMKYIVDLPPLWKDDKPFVNSSPELLKPLSDYACVGQLYYTNFTGSDRDGDSLVYKLAAPLNSSSSNALPVPQPKPNILVQWKQGFAVERMIPGSPALRISDRGLLTVNPSSAGLYVFSVIVEEWRDGEKIGQVQRDFQMLAISEGCEPPDPPSVALEIPGDPDFDPEVDVLQYNTEEDKCFTFLVNNLEPGERVTFRAEPVNFDEAVDMFSVNDTLVGEDGEPLRIEVCAPLCPPIRDDPFIVDLIAGKNACPLPQLDTIRVAIEVEPPPNDFPQLNALDEHYLVAENSVLLLDLTATDADEDIISPQLFIEDGTDPAGAGMTFDIITNEAGLLEAQFIWNTDCEMVDFSEKQHFRVGFLMEDHDLCEVANPEITWVNLEVDLPPNTDPVVVIDSEDSISVGLGETIAFDVSASDEDHDFINLILATPASQRSVGASFESARGEGEANSFFTWTARCDHLSIDENNTFEFFFIANDEDKCQVQNSDTLTFKVHINVPENRPPEFLPYRDTVIDVNQPLVMDITAVDPDAGDSLTIAFFDAIRRPDSPSLSFKEASGAGSVTSVLEWTPECDLLDFGQTSAYYDLAFLVYDNGCPASLFDTLRLTVEVRETRESFDRFEPPNVFTPNHDGKNDTFTLTNLPNPRYNLPVDNCDDAFQYVSIYDRNGKTVFETFNREFSWDGEDVAAGTYFYLIKYTRTEYKGYLQVLK